MLADAKLVDLDIAWREREDEASVLAAQGFPSMGISLRVYALEIRLKTIIYKHLNLDVLPKACKTHDLAELIIFTGKLQELEQPANNGIRQNWDRLVDFSKRRLNDLRYIPRGNVEANELATITDALDHPSDGVLSWLSKHP